MKKSIQSLKNLIYNVTSENVWSLIDGGSIVAYAGIDPTGSGIHIGHLLWIHVCLHLLKLGNKVIILIGGFTGSIGDPTDKTQTRNKIDESLVRHNEGGLLYDVQKIFRPYGDNVVYVNNKDWLEKMTLKDYMHYGYHVSVNKKTNMETFRNRLNNNNPLTMTEFMYPDLQMLDFVHLYKIYGCNLQVGGADQWGNIAFGAHYTSQIVNNEVYGVVSHLLIDSFGSKFSKSTGAFHLKNYEEVYHGCMNLTDDMSVKIAFMFDVEVDSNPQNTKKNISKYIISLFEPHDFKDIYDRIVHKAGLLFRAIDANNIPDEYFINVSSNQNKLENVLSCAFGLTEFDSMCAIKDKSVKVNGEVLLENKELFGTFKISYGKKKHAFIRIVDI